MGVFRGRRSTTISPALSRSCKARRLVSRLMPSFFNLPFGSGKVRFLAFQEAYKSSAGVGGLGRHRNPPQRDLDEGFGLLALFRSDVGVNGYDLDTPSAPHHVS